jgi:hypothetical protein
MSETFQTSDDLGSINVNQRLNYVLGQVLGVKEFKQEQAYFLNKANVQNRELHGYGTVRGLAVTCENGEITVSPGLAIDRRGQEIWIDEPQCAQLNNWLNSPIDPKKPDSKKNWDILQALDPSKPNRKVVYVTLRYLPHETEEQLILSEPCRTDTDTLKPTRILDCFELKLSPELPRQDEENHVRRLGELLAQIDVYPNLNKPLINGQQCERSELIEKLCKAVDNLSVFKNVILPEADALNILNEVLQYWITHTRPNLKELYDPTHLLLEKVELIKDDVLLERFNTVKESLALFTEREQLEPVINLQNMSNLFSKIEINPNFQPRTNSEITALKSEFSNALDDPSRIELMGRVEIPKAQLRKILPDVVRSWRDNPTLPDSLKPQIEGIMLDEADEPFTPDVLKTHIRTFTNAYQTYLRTGDITNIHQLPTLRVSYAETYREMRQAISALKSVESDYILLARVQFDFDLQNKIVQNDTVDYVKRPYLLHTRLLQELVNQLIVKFDGLIVKDGNVGIGTTEPNPDAKLHVDGNVFINGDLFYRGKIDQLNQFAVRPQDMLPHDGLATELDRGREVEREGEKLVQLTNLAGYPALRFKGRGIVSFSMLCPSFIRNVSIPKVFLRLYCTADKALENGVEITWGIRWRWVRAIGPIAPNAPFYEPPSILGSPNAVPPVPPTPLRRVRPDGSAEEESLLSMIELHRFPDPEFSEQELLKMTLFGQDDQRYLHISDPLEMQPNALSADYLVVYLELEKSNDLTVYLLMSELRF